MQIDYPSVNPNAAISDAASNTIRLSSSSTSAVLCGDIPHTTAMTSAPSLKRFKLLAHDCFSRVDADAATQHVPRIDQELISYISYFSTKMDIHSDVGLHFWITNDSAILYPLLTPIAQDLVSAPASQAYSKRVFSLCGDHVGKKAQQGFKTFGISCFFLNEQNICQHYANWFHHCHVFEVL